MNERNPLEIKNSKKLRVGRRLGDKKERIEYKSTSVRIKKVSYEKILRAVRKDGSLSLIKIVNNCLDKHLDKELTTLTKIEK